ncbi:MAG: putative LysR-family transcriptional regulator, partial [Friedmanniella sp.]|nr:putative LysR-family transcriptional regulator [Friedmanniella sp.]
EVAALEQAAAEDRQELQIGYAWSALGGHTTAFARTWARDHPRRPVVFTQVNTPTAGLAEEAVEVAVLRRPPTDRRYTAEQVGTEVRFAALATDHPLAHRRVLDVADFAGTTVGVDSRTGTTTDELWSDQARPAAFRETHHVDDWLTLVAAGEVVGITTEATVAQYPRPGVVYRRVRGVPEVPVWLAWRRVSPPPQVEQLVALARSVYAG